VSIDSLGSSAEEIRRRAAEFEWYHTLDLGDGIVTAGVYDLGPFLHHYGIPASLEGRTVLDVGPGHGYFAFEFERRRAAKVTTIELPNWADHDASPVLRTWFDQVGESPDKYPYHRGAFGFAIDVRRSRIERRFCNIYDLSAEREGTYDLVFCASVLLHLTDPLRALYGLRRVCRGEAIICTGIDDDPSVASQPRALFQGTAEGQAFWFPTMTCLEQMARAAGFARVERVSTFMLTTVDGKFNTPHGTIRAFVA
jgi:tRNA (mo5U34)-methyltransferase